MVLRLLLHVNESLIAAVGTTESPPLIVGHITGRAALLLPPAVLQPYYPRLDKVVDESNAVMLATIVEHNHRIAILDTSCLGIRTTGF
jgi:uncharacterized membrane protein SpoIIM required for sporulation